MTKVTCQFGTLLWTLNHGPWDVLAGFLPSSRSFNFRILARGSPLTVNCICAEKHLKATWRFALRSEKSSASLLPSQWFEFCSLVRCLVNPCDILIILRSCTQGLHSFFELCWICLRPLPSSQSLCLRMADSHGLKGDDSTSREGR